MTSLLSIAGLSRVMARDSVAQLFSGTLQLTRDWELTFL
jgi:hypothetical protein